MPEPKNICLGIITRFREIAVADVEHAALTDFYYQLEDELAPYEPFSQLLSSLLAMPGGGAITSRGWVGQWIASKLKEGFDAEHILNGIIHDVALNSVSFLEVRRLVGVKVDKPVEIEPGMWLYPNECLADHHAREAIFSLGFGVRLIANDAALVFKLDVGPILDNANGRDEGANSSAARRLESQEREDRAEEFLRAIVVQGKFRVGFFGRYYEAIQPSILSRPFGYIFKGGEAPMHAAQEDFDLATTSELRKKLSRFTGKQKVALGLAIDRLRFASIDREFRDRAIDLGIALEAALMYGDEKANQEIRNKIGVRAAWLLGGNLDARRATMSGVKALYDVRSKAAHGGELPAFDLARNVALVQEILLAIINFGHFPDWNDLVLGGKV